MEKSKNFKDYYNLGKSLGRGKFGQVYEATTKDQNEKRAIKILDKKTIKKNYKEMNFQDPTDEEMEPYIKCFDNEVRNMKLAMGKDGDNPNAVKFYDCFEDENEYAIVMELCDTTLLNYLDKIKEEENYKIISQLNKTVKIMVDTELVYIDIRLENILIKFTNPEKTEYIVKLKLTDDIGLMKELENLNNNENMREYNCIDAPEIIKDDEHSNKSDLWSLGVIIYVLYFKEYPYKGSTSDELLENIKKGKNLLKKTGNEDLDNLIRGLLMEEPKDRINWNQYFNHPFFVKKKDKSENFRDYYDIEKELGNQGFATVFKAKAKDTGDLKAIKVFDINRLKSYFKRKYLRIPSEEDMKPYIDSFFNEIKHIQIVEGKNNENNNTVKFYEYYNNEEELASVMELCDSNLLNYFVDKNRPLTPDEIGDILSQLNNSFKIMKDNELVHLALNLENILIKYENESKFVIKLKLTNDSCLLKDLQKALKLNKSTNIKFISPEILKNEKVNDKCDLWSLGVIIYTLYFKDHPFKGDNENDILEEISHKSISYKKDNDYNDYLVDLIRKLLVEDPVNRLSWDEYFKHPFIRQRENVRNYYEIKEKIGQSRFAIIYKAIERENKNQERAIKIYDKNRIKNEFKRKKFRDATYEDLKPYIDGFNNEINHMKILEEYNNNSYSIKFYEHFHTDDEFAIVMELCDDNLLNLYSNKKFNFNPKKIKEILNILNESFRIMVDNSIVHRALNFENILVKYIDNEKTKYILKLKLTDDSLRKDLLIHNNKGKINGGLFFIAPEILKGKYYSEECDLWSLGVIIYALLFREYPFKGDNEFEILKNIQNNCKNLKINSDDHNLNDLLRQLLIEDPKERMTWEQYFNHSLFKTNDELEVKKNFKGFYELGKILGQAGYATVYEAKIKGKNEKRAAKIFDKKKIIDEFKRKNIKIPTEAEMKPQIDRFLNEVKNMKIVQGNNNENEYTVKLYEYFYNNNEYISVMELCDDNLLNVFARKPDNFEPEEILELLKQLNYSFKIMVDNKLLHRAINLENILIKYNNNDKTSYIYKLKLANDSCLLKDIHKFNQLQSDFNYHAPEILKNEKDYNEKCDLWSIGVLIYVLIFREHPFPGDTQSEVLKEISNRINYLKKSDNPYLNDLIRGLLVPEPKKRLTWVQYFNHSFFHEKHIYSEGNQYDDAFKNKEKKSNNKEENYNNYTYNKKYKNNSNY